MKTLFRILLLTLPTYGIEISAQTVSGQVKGHDYVDLELPSGRLWATYNVGAESPIDFGDFFAWGETEPKTDYSQENYKWFSDGKYTKYCTYSFEGNVDDKTKLDDEDDAAIAIWGEHWRMPTDEEQEELINGCNWEFTKDFNGTGVAGNIGTSKTNNAIIFLPAGGMYSGVNQYGIGYYGSYLSSTLEYKSTEYLTYIHAADFSMDMGSTLRYRGCNIRAVVNKKEASLYYTVSFYTQDSVLIETQTVEEGMAATHVDAPFVKGHRFSGWSDSSFIRVKKNIDVYAQYTKADESDPIHEYVDLGLPSGTKWATYNVGATRPYEYGDYFAWGETKTKESYEWSTYTLCTPSGTGILSTPDKFNKYVLLPEMGTVDNKKVLDPDDDAATSNWGKLWRTPTKEDYDELKKGCSWQWIYDYQKSGISGYLGISDVNDNVIFFPAAGNYFTDSKQFELEQGLYWTSTIEEDRPDYAHMFFFDDWFYDLDYSQDRYFGQSVRAVLGGSTTHLTNVSDQGLMVYTTSGAIHIRNAQSNCLVQVFDMNSKIVASGETDTNGNTDITISDLKNVYVVTAGNQSSKVEIK